MPLDRDDGSDATAAAAPPPPAQPSEFEQKVTKFLMREVPDSCLVKGVVCTPPPHAYHILERMAGALMPTAQVSSVMGGGMGFLFGGFMNSMEMRPCVTHA